MILSLIVWPITKYARIPPLNALFEVHVLSYCMRSVYAGSPRYFFKMMSCLHWQMENDGKKLNHFFSRQVVTLSIRAMYDTWQGQRQIISLLQLKPLCEYSLNFWMDYNGSRENQHLYSFWKNLQCQFMEQWQDSCTFMDFGISSKFQFTAQLAYSNLCIRFLLNVYLLRKSQL